MRTVIVSDGEQRAALAVVRSLGAAGYRCIVTANGRSSLAGESRYAARQVSVRDALREPAAFAQQVATLAAAERADLVLPIAEPAMLALLPIRDVLAPAVIPFPGDAAFRALSNKAVLLDAATALGISIPKQVVARSADVRALALDTLRFPVVLKPARSVGEAAGVREKLGVSYASSATECAQKLRALPAAAFPLLIQERIDGAGIGVFLLLWGGHELARFAHRRRSEKPPSGGVSVYRESVAADDDLLARSRALLDAFGWHGVAMVEYKRDARTGRPYLMEVNGRFWGSLQLAIDAGVDFPRLLASAAMGDPVEPVTSYRVGVRSRWWWGQVDHLIACARTRDRVTMTSRRRRVPRALRDLVLAPFRHDDYEEVLRWNDPRPFWRETVQWMRAQ